MLNIGVAHADADHGIVGHRILKKKNGYKHDSMGNRAPYSPEKLRGTGMYVFCGTNKRWTSGENSCKRKKKKGWSLQKQKFEYEKTGPTHRALAAGTPAIENDAELKGTFESTEVRKSEWGSTLAGQFCTITSI